MTFEDRISISTPEGLDIELNLAGLGSRIAAAIVDTVILGFVLTLAAFGMFGLADWFSSPLLAIGIGWLVVTLLVIGYFVVFEVFNDGKTPGKSMFGIRVLGLDGEPVGFGPSMVRNLLRLVDLFPVLPILGPIAILVSDRNQRIGDLAARTLVVRLDRSHQAAAAMPVLDPRATSWDVSGLESADLDLARRFVARRSDLTPHKRQEHAEVIAARLRTRVPGLPTDVSDEWVVEQVLAAKSARLEG
ncbi:MAG: RDD family protein [Acidimicrobiia bacterium]